VGASFASTQWKSRKTFVKDKKTIKTSVGSLGKTLGKKDSITESQSRELLGLGEKGPNRYKGERGISNNRWDQQSRAKNLKGRNTAQRLNEATDSQGNISNQRNRRQPEQQGKMCSLQIKRRGGIRWQMPTVSPKDPGP